MLTNSQGKALGLKMESHASQAEQRADAVSRLKLLAAPGKGQEQVRDRDIHLRGHVGSWNAVAQHATPLHCSTLCVYV